MNETYLQNALNHLDEDLIESHIQARDVSRKNRRAPKWILPVAASLAVTAAVGMAVGVMRGPFVFDEPVGKPPQEMLDVAISTEYVWVYSVGDDGILVRDKQLLSCEAQTVFAAWREANGFGEDVRLTDHRSEGNGQTWTYEFEGEGVAVHKPGDTYTLTLTVEGLEAYLTPDIREPVLESLKKTMTGYSSTPYASVQILLT